MPIRGASIPSAPTLLPGAPRPYRAGTHQGVDFYDGYVGVPIRKGTEVVAVAPGQVIRADGDYREATPAEMKRMLQISIERGATPPDILDRLRGRQVWIDHGDGVVSRSVHLDGIAPGVQTGRRVEAGQVIGYVGNSGTEEAAAGSDAEPHFELQIWIGDRYLGEGLPPAEARQRFEEVFRGSTGG